MDALHAGAQPQYLGHGVGERLVGPLVQLQNLLHFSAAQLVLQSCLAELHLFVRIVEPRHLRGAREPHRRLRPAPIHQVADGR